MRNSNIEYIASAVGGKKTTASIVASNADLGTETGNPVIEGHDYHFCDFPFTKQKKTFEDHLEVVKKLEPAKAVAPDIQDGRELPEVLEMADELMNYSNEVIVVPKTVSPSKVPDKFTVGYPNQEDFGGSHTVEAWEFRQARSVHILGGSPEKAAELAYYLKNVTSYDSNSAIKMALAPGKIWKGLHHWEKRPDLSAYERILRSLNNIEEYFSTLKLNRQTSLQDVY